VYHCELHQVVQPSVALFLLSILLQRDAVQSQTARGEREVATRFLNYAFDEQTLLLGYRPPDFAFSLPQFLEVGGRSLEYFF